MWLKGSTSFWMHKNVTTCRYGVQMISTLCIGLTWLTWTSLVCACVCSTTQHANSSWQSKRRAQYAVVSRLAYDSASSAPGIKIWRSCMLSFDHNSCFRLNGTHTQTVCRSFSRWTWVIQCQLQVFFQFVVATSKFYWMRPICKASVQFHC